MALHDPIHAPTPDETGQALALPADLAELVAGRDSAVKIWTDLRAHYHTQRELAASVCIGGNLSLRAEWGDRYSDSPLTRHFVAANEGDAFADFATKEIDRRCWSSLMERMGLDQLLDRQAREEFAESLRNDPPHFTVENVRATFGTIWGSRRDLYLRGIANVFMAMDRRFRSHDAFEIGNRLIIERAMGLDSWAGWNDYNRRDTLHDVERIFRELDGKGPLSMHHAPTEEWLRDHPEESGKAGIVVAVEEAKKRGGLPSVVDGDYFRVRVFGNGNLHLWFTRKDLLKQVNALLLEYYKPVEGDVSEGGPSYEKGPAYHATPAKNFGQFFSNDTIAAAVLARLDLDLSGLRVLEPSAGSGVLAKAASAAGAAVTCVEIQSGLAHELRAVHRFGSVVEGDFTRMTPAQLGTFDAVIMNPPFDRGRDCDHVRHAFEFLKPGGVLVAVMSARAEHASDARHKALHALVEQCGRNWGWAWRDLPERSFAHAGTNVNTVTLYLRKPR